MPIMLPHEPLLVKIHMAIYRLGAATTMDASRRAIPPLATQPRPCGMLSPVAELAHERKQRGRRSARCAARIGRNSYPFRNVVDEEALT